VKKKPLNKEPLKKNKQSHYKQQDTSLIRNRYFDLLGLTIILLLGTIIYANSFKCSFHFDDNIHIVGNPAIKNLQDAKVWWNYSDRPVSIFTFALNYHFHQLDVFYYHIANLLIHLINACLIWWLTLLIFSSPVLRDQLVSKHKKVLAFFTALLFVSHPLATQSVTYIIQRQNSLAAMFYILSLALYVKGRLTAMQNKNKYILFAGSLISSVLAVLSKENAFTLPLAIVLFEIFFLQTKKQSIRLKDYRFILLTASLLCFIISLFFKFPLSIFGPIPPAQGNTYTITSLNYLFTQFSVIVKYIQLLILPINQNLDYDFPISDNFFELRTLFSFLLLFGLIILAVFLFKKHRIFSFGICWFFLTLSIESGIIPINDVIFEHRTYLPSYGFFLMCSTGIYAWLQKKNKFLAVSVLVLIIGANSFLTYERNNVWKDELTLWANVVSKSPNKARPYCNRGIAYDGLGHQDKALADYSKAIEIDPAYSDAYSNRGIIYGTRGQYNKAIADFTKAIEFAPDDSFSIWNRGITYSILQQWDKAITDYTRSIEINPYTYDPYFKRGESYDKLRQWQKAIADYSMAIEINPAHDKAYNNRGLVFANLKQWDKAIADYSKAIGINPGYSEAYNNRELAYRQMNSK